MNVPTLRPHIKPRRDDETDCADACDDNASVNARRPENQSTYEASQDQNPTSFCSSGGGPVPTLDHNPL